MGTEWTDSSGMCNAIYGNFEGNTDNLHQLMRHHFRESFRFLLMGSIFDTDEVNRMGIHQYLGYVLVVDPEDCWFGLSLV